MMKISKQFLKIIMLMIIITKIEVLTVTVRNKKPFGGKKLNILSK